MQSSSGDRNAVAARDLDALRRGLRLDDFPQPVQRTAPAPPVPQPRAHLHHSVRSKPRLRTKAHGDFRPRPSHLPQIPVGENRDAIEPAAAAALGDPGRGIHFGEHRLHPNPVPPRTGRPTRRPPTGRGATGRGTCRRRGRPGESRPASSRPCRGQSRRRGRRARARGESAGVEAASATMGPLVRDGEIPAAPSWGVGLVSSSKSSAIAGAARCGCCSRVPLVGENVTLRRHRGVMAWVCEPCGLTRRRGRRGVALRSDRVRSFGGALNVRRAA